MVILDVEKHEDLQRLLSNNRDYIVLDTKAFQYQTDKETFKNAIAVLDLINTVHWANRFYKGLNSKIRILTEILYKCMDSGFTDTPFTAEELTAYYNTTVMIEDFFVLITPFNTLESYTPYELEFVLFGLSYKEQGYLTIEQKDELHDAYGKLYSAVRMKHLPVKAFIEETKKLITDIKKRAL